MTSVLIANRGEIAVRIHRAVAALGLRSVAVYAPEDADARHVALADEAHPLPGTGVAAYLDAERILAIARETGCGVIHPGYGFLSESAAFATACADAGITFAGPAPETLALFGDKARARELAQRHGVPVLRATGGATSLAEAGDFLASLDDGVMIKAIGGGGGRGMRVVHSAAELAWAYERCRSEAARAFGRPDVYLEQLLPRAKHIEVQVIGDGTGEVSQLGERECSVQRRHQKLVEFAPSPWLPPRVRDALTDAAVRMAKATEYAGLATFEFLIDADSPKRFYFIETNPRLQVEHTVTEELTGVDLVAAQLRIARGQTLAELGLRQHEIPEPRGFAIQARVNAESIAPDGTTRAAAGTLDSFAPPTGPGVRVDTHGYPGYRTDCVFDSLLAKVIIRSRVDDFASAAAQAERALAEFAVAGVNTNIDALRAVLRHQDFRSGGVTTRFLDEHMARLAPADSGSGSAASGSAGDVEAASAGTTDVAPGAAPGDAVVRAEFAGTVVAVPVKPGVQVAEGAPLVVLEAMKMEHVLPAATSGIVREVAVAVGDRVAERLPLVMIEPAEVDQQAAVSIGEVDLDETRVDLAAVIARHEAGLDAARPEAVARRRKTGQRTARENIADLCDDGSFAEYGALAIAAQRQRRSLDDLIANTPADGLVAGVGNVNGDRCVVMSYDYTVLAGTQGVLNHAKTDRMLELAHRRALPVVLFAEGGGGRPGDTDTTAASGLDVTTFGAMGRLSGRVPTVGIAAGRCFAGNAALLGCCDVIIATADATIGMGGPAMIEGGGLGRYRPEEVGPLSMQVPNGVVDVAVADEAEAVEVAKRYLSYFQGDTGDWDCADQRRLRHVVPENRVRVYDVREAVELIADTGSVLELRPEFGVGMITALVRVEGRPMGLVANNPKHLGGAIDSDAADKLARFLQLCDAHGLPVVSLCDTPGFMVGPDAERTATVRHFSRLFVGGANLRVPVITIVLRKGYGLGAQAMAAGSFRAPVATLAWPTGEIGGMGLAGAVRLGFRKELEAIDDPAERQRAFDALVAEAYERGKAVNAAAVFELDDVIDPADTRRWIVTSLSEAPDRPAEGRSFIDTW